MTTLIYLHGLDSDPNATKALLTAQYAQKLGIDVIRPNLNCPPDEVISTITPLLDNNSVLIGSSLGGYFANLLSDMTGVPCVLLNPSIRPDLSFQRFLDDNAQTPKITPSDDTVIYTTKGGWAIVYQDLGWFEKHKIRVAHPNKVGVWLQLGDELLDAKASEAFYLTKNASVLTHAGGDHRISDYADHVAKVVDWAITLGQR